jgi:hypothetical protein
MESLNSEYSPVPNFRIATFSDGNINLDKINEMGCQVDLTDMQGQSITSIYSVDTFDFGE